MTDIIQPIGPHDRDVDPVLRVERAHDEREQRERRERERRPKPSPPPAAAAPQDEGAVEGDDGRLHIDIRA